MHSLIGIYGPDTVLAGERDGDSVSPASFVANIESLFSSVNSTAEKKNVICTF